MPNGDKDYKNLEWWEKQYPGRGAELYQKYLERVKYYQQAPAQPHPQAPVATQPQAPALPERRELPQWLQGRVTEDREPIQVEDQDTGDIRTLTIDRTNRVYDEQNRLVAEFDPKTGEFSEPPWALYPEDVLRPVAKGLEWALSPIAMLGQTFQLETKPETLLSEEKASLYKQRWDMLQKYREGEITKEEYENFLEKIRPPISSLLPGGEIHEKYRQLSIGEQLFAEAPAWIALGSLPSAGGIRGVLAPAAVGGGPRTILPKVVRAALKPVAVAEEAPAQLISKLKPKPLIAEDPTVVKLTGLIEGAKPARVETEALRHAELQKRVARAAGILERGEGEAAFKAARAPLKGELPKAVFEPPTAGLVPEDVAHLYNLINKSEMRFFTKFNTAEALQKLLSGQIPTQSELVLLEDMFGSRLVKAVLAKRPLSVRAWETTLDVINLPKANLASVDLSAPLRQGFFLAGQFPKQWAGAFKPMLRAIRGEKATQAIAEGIERNRFYSLAMDAQLYQAPISGLKAAPRIAMREEAFMTRFTKYFPWIKVSERTYLTYLNKFRMDSFAKVAAGWEGVPGITMKTYRQLATLINWGTGRGPIGNLKSQVPLLNSVFFAIRLQTSRVALLPPFGYMKFTEPAVRKIYTQSLIKTWGSVATILGLLKLSGVASVEVNPKSTDFGKIRIGNTRIDPWGGFQPYFRVISQLIMGQRKTTTGRIQDVSRMETLERFWRTKQAPVFALINDIIKGETFIGHELSLEPKSVLEQAYNRLTPLFIQDLVDATREEGLVGGFVASPGFWGMGIISYPGSLDWLENHVKDVPQEMLMGWQRNMAETGIALTYKDLNQLQRNWLRRYREELGEEEERRGTSTSFYGAQSETYEELTTEYHTKLEELTGNVVAGKLAIDDYIIQSEHLRNEYFGPAARIWREKMREKLEPLLHKSLEKWHDEEIKPEDKAYEEYMEIRANPPMVHGKPDWDTWVAQLDGFLMTKEPEVRDYIAQRRLDWINNLPPNAQKVQRLIVECETGIDGYYSLPEGKARTIYSDAFPEVFIKLFILGRITRMPKTQELASGINALYHQYMGVAYPWELKIEE